VICTMYWWVGFLFLVLAYIVHFTALPFADVVLLSSNTAFSVIFTQLWAICFLKEKPIWKYDLTSCILIIVGSQTIVWSSSHESIEHNYEQSMKLLLDKDAIYCYILFVVFVIFCIIVQHHFRMTIHIFQKDLLESRKV